MDERSDRERESAASESGPTEHSLRSRVAELENATEDLSQLFDLSLDLLCIATMDGHFRRINPAFMHTLGYEKRELLRRPFLDFVHPDDIDHTLREMQALAQGHPTIHFENRYRTAWGEWRWLEWSAMPVPAREAIYAAARDVTDRKRAELALRESESRFRTLCDAAPVLIWMATPDGSCNYVNKSWLAFTGRPLEDEIGDGWAQGVHPDDLDRVLQIFRSSIRAGTSVRAEFRLRRADGEWRWVLATGVPLLADGEVRGYIGSCLDVTAEKEASLQITRSRDELRRHVEERTRELQESNRLLRGEVEERAREESRRRRMEENLRRAQRLESLGLLAGGVAHDFNNLLTAILGNASLALADLALDSPARDHLVQIERTSLQAADLTRQLLAFSGKGRFVVRPVDLVRLVDETVELLQRSTPSRIRLLRNRGSALPAVEADRGQLRQVVLNLVTNATEAIQDEGDIVVETLTLEVGPDELLRDTFGERIREGRFVVLRVSDDGAGISPQTRERMFDPFFTTKFTGRGLGLAAVLGVVRGHQGHVRIESEPGRGTRFEILLPASTALEDTVEDEDAVDASYRGAILVVDDETAVREVACAALRAHGFVAVPASDGREALELLSQSPGSFAAVLLDLTMPVLDGEAVLAEIRRLEPSLPVVLMSGYGEQQTVERFSGQGLAGFLHKPFRPADVARALGRALRTSSDSSDDPGGAT